MAVSDESRPRLASKVRIRLDRPTGRYLLLYPERGLLLNGTAADVVRLLTGEHTVAGIVTELCARYTDQTPATIAGEVYGFLKSLADRGLLRVGE